MLYHCAMINLSATNRCVKCGLCLPHCPTFALTGNEADSPRGRLNLMQSIGQDDTPYTAGLFRHLDQCLQCGSCEAMCPSGVPFGALMDSARAAIEPHRKRSLPGRMLRHLALQTIASRTWTKLLSIGLRIHRRLGLQWLIDRAPLIAPGVKRLNRLIAAPSPPHHQRTAVDFQPTQRGTVNLFRGCAGELFDERTLDAAQRLLEHLGYRVSSPAQQRCCGALHQHNGAPATAARLAEKNQIAFGGNTDPILVTASGCTAHLKAYGDIYGKRQAESFAQRVNDILHFVNQLNKTELPLQSFAETLAVHIPCTHRNALRQQQDILDILNRIPDAVIRVINAEGGCCGAAGSYMLTQNALAERLRDPLIDTLVQSGASALLTTNIGCAMHLQAGLKERGVAIDTLHPVVLLDRLLKP